MSELLACSIIDEARLRSHLGRDAGGEDDVEVRLTRACNRSIAWMERRTARGLKARNYRTQATTTTSGSTAANATTINVASTASLKAGDDVLCAGLEAGTTVQSITSATAFVVSKKVLSTIASGTTMTFGSAPLTIDVDRTSRFSATWPWDGVAELECPEKPLIRANLYAIYWLDSNGTRTALDLTACRVEEATGRIYLLRDAAPPGTQNIQIECRAGYEQPSATAIGHAREWESLAAIQLRVAEVFFTDDTQLRGRATQLTVGGISMGSTGDQAMPSDIEGALRPFWRLSA